MIRPRGDSTSGSLNEKTLVTRTLYDDLSRRIAVIENAEDADEGSLVWTAGSPGRWVLDLPGVADPDTDRVTSFVYDGAGRIVLQVAHTKAGVSGSGEEAQATQYVYGVTTSDTPASALASNDLLREVVYPDESTGEPGSGNSYRVRYAYNRQGKLIGMIDQNGTEHIYTRDARGRLERDEIDTFGANIDDTVVALEMAYDGFGRLALALSKDDGDGARGAETVTYTYDTSSSGNYSRLSGLRYPGDGFDTLEYGYGTSGGIDDLVSRVVGITEAFSSGSLGLVGYTYAGLGMPVIVDYPVIGVQLAYDLEPTGSDIEADGYPSLDRHGRVLRHAWISRSGSVSGSGRTTYPGSAFDVRYGHDVLSNRVSALDGRGSHIRDKDWWYEYDGLNRLETARRGHADATGVYAPGSRRWSLDTLGNWGRLDIDTDGDGEFGEGSGETLERDDRVHNMANEVSSLTPKVFDGTMWLSGVTRSPVHDASGNLRATAAVGVADTVSPHVYTYDGWNRLVRVERDVDQDQVYTLGEYEHNALHWRTRRRADTSDGVPSGTLDQERFYYYSASWQLLEEHVENDDETGYRSRQFWGLRYIDDAVAKRIDREDDGFGAGDDRFYYVTDAQFSVRRIHDSSGGVVERIDYTPYGEPVRFSPADVSDSSGVSLPDGVRDSHDSSKFGALFSAGSSDANVAPPFGVLDIADINHFASLWDPTGDFEPGPAEWVSNPNNAGAGPDNSVGFSGYLFDFEAGTYHQRHRVYDPGLGRWLTRDPAGYVDGGNLYEYVASRPIQVVDFNGLIGIKIAGAFSVTLSNIIRAGQNNWLNISISDEVAATDAQIAWFVTASTVDCDRVEFAQIDRMTKEILGGHNWKWDTNVSSGFPRYPYQRPLSRSTSLELRQRMWDEPGLGPNPSVFSRYLEQDFESCVVCRSGCDRNTIYGCARWGHRFTRLGSNEYSVYRYIIAGGDFSTGVFGTNIVHNKRLLPTSTPTISTGPHPVAGARPSNLFVTMLRQRNP